jgi:hypothetical protein
MNIQQLRELIQDIQDLELLWNAGSEVDDQVSKLAAHAQILSTLLAKHSAEDAAVAGDDTARLDSLERLIDQAPDKMLLLHHGNGVGKNITGLGLGNTGRSLRQAIDGSTAHLATPKDNTP